MKWYDMKFPQHTNFIHIIDLLCQNLSGQGKCPICRRGEQKNDPIYLDNLFCRFVLICQLSKYVTLDNVQILLLEPIMNQMLHIAMGLNPSSISFIFLYFVHPIFHFWFLLNFGNEVTKKWKYYIIFCLHFARQDEQDRTKIERKSSN